MVDVLKGVSTRKTAQSQPAGGVTVKNAAGGYVFGIDDYARLRRFLILGTSGGTYYTSAPELTRDNADVVIKLAQSEPVKLVDEIVAVSEAGRAPKNKQAIFALAIAASLADEAGRAYALAHLNKVCRTAPHLYSFVEYVEQFRGWGPALKRAVGKWFTERPVDRLAYQAVKYRQREGWTGRDLLRLARPNPLTPDRDALFEYMVATWQAGNEKSKYHGYTPDFDQLPPVIRDYTQASDPPETTSWVEIVGRGNGMSWEMLPDAALNLPEVWEALLEQGVPQTALMRQLPRLTNLGLTTGRLGTQIAGQLTDPELLKRGRIHPINVLVAMKTYASGRSMRGSSTWTPTGKISKALDDAFYAAYGAVEPANKRTLIALDVSGSMDRSAGDLPVTCAEAGAALALVTLATEPDSNVIAFSDGQSIRSGRYGLGMRGWNDSICGEIDIAGRRLDDVCRYTSDLNFGRTDCSLPMLWAMQNKREYDTFVIITDNETWFGDIHPWQALKQYREKMVGDARLVVLAMTPTGTSITDPSDKGQLDIAGMDTAVPNLISAFSRGEV